MLSSKQETADACCQQIRWDDLDMGPIETLIRLAVAEDNEGSGLRIKPIQTGDATSALLPEGQRLVATARARETLTLSGLPLVPHILAAYGSSLTFEPRAQDGDSLEQGEAIGVLSGLAKPALSAERVLLNFLQRLSGIATTTRSYAIALEGSNTRLLDTRKTTPGYRYLEKYAVACGGGWNHRMGLFDRVMLKDNHLATFGNDLAESTRAAVETSRQRAPHLKIEMEVDRIGQIDAALNAGVDIILLDNFPVDAIEKAVTIIGSRAATEISGNVTLDTLPLIRELGCDFVSTGALVHKSSWVDIGLDWEEQD